MSGPYPGVLVPREGGGVIYGEQHTPFTQDRIIWGFIVCTWILVLAAIVPYISFFQGKNKKRALFNSIIFVSIYIGCVIMLCNFGKDWQTGHVTTRTPFSPYRNFEITAEIGLRVGLRGINVTLEGTPIEQHNRSIYYNEEFSWEWQQGNIGQGPYANSFTNSYIAATQRGIPVPIRQVAAWFILEGDYIHWGRFYRVAGWYTHILMWLAFVSWAITNILFFLSIRHAAIGTMVTGIIMLLANIVWGGVVNQAQDPLRIPFRDGVITLAYGWCFYLCLFSGLGCLLAGALLFTLLKLPRTEALITSMRSQSVANFSQSRYFNKSFKNPDTAAKIVEMETMDKKKKMEDKVNGSDSEGEGSEGEDSGDEGKTKKSPMMERGSEEQMLEGEAKKKKGISFQQ